MPRPTKLTRQVQDLIVLALRTGNHLSVAARAAGVSEATVHRWLKAPGKIYREFAAAVDRAMAEFEVRAVAQANQSAPFKVLERRHPERWGRHRADGGGWTETAEVEPASERPAAGPYINDIPVPPEWIFPLNKIFAAAARGHSPEEFFERTDRFPGLREDAEPLGRWWREPGEPIDGPTNLEVSTSGQDEAD